MVPYPVSLKHDGTDGTDGTGVSR